MKRFISVLFILLSFSAGFVFAESAGSDPFDTLVEKLLKDCMTQCGFWHDDAQVVREICEKDWSEYPGIYIEIHKLGECKNEQI